ncbi:MAG TPA: hypothetical protein VMS65_17840 [Polyangiaceae bacterium]|nr:hypothetical protein [Polyangiaceae bacterium]
MSDAPLALRVPQAIELWRDHEWQRLWLSLQHRQWKSFAVVAAAAGAPADFPLRVAVTLARTGMMHLGTPIQVADGTKIPLTSLAMFIEEMERCVEQGDRIVLALAPPNENPITTALARSADAALLCIMLERMKYGESRETADRIGTGKFVGSAIFRPDGVLNGTT